MFIFAIEQDICVMRSNGLLKSHNIAWGLSTSFSNEKGVSQVHGPVDFYGGWELVAWAPRGRGGHEEPHHDISGGGALRFGQASMMRGSGIWSFDGEANGAPRCVAKAQNISGVMKGGVWVTFYRLAAMRVVRREVVAEEMEFNFVDYGAGRGGDGATPFLELERTGWWLIFDFLWRRRMDGGSARWSVATRPEAAGAALVGGRRRQAARPSGPIGRVGWSADGLAAGKENGLLGWARPEVTWANMKENKEKENQIDWAARRKRVTIDFGLRWKIRSPSKSRLHFLNFNPKFKFKSNPYSTSNKFKYFLKTEIWDFWIKIILKLNSKFKSIGF
jgi:hypothetical protein